MSKLVAERVHSHADRLHLAHLAQNAEALDARAESTQMGYFDSSTSCSRRRSACGRGGGSATP